MYYYYYMLNMPSLIILYEAWIKGYFHVGLKELKTQSLLREWREMIDGHQDKIFYANLLVTKFRQFLDYVLREKKLQNVTL